MSKEKWSYHAERLLPVRKKSTAEVAASSVAAGLGNRQNPEPKQPTRHDYATQDEYDTKRQILAYNVAIGDTWSITDEMQHRLEQELQQVDFPRSKRPIGAWIRD